MGVHLLDNLEECSVELGEDLVAVFKLKANIVGLHPGYVLNTETDSRDSQDENKRWKGGMNSSHICLMTMKRKQSPKSYRLK